MKLARWKYDREDGIIKSRIQEIPDVISIKLNDDWKRLIAELMETLEQTKHSTIIKQSLLLTHTKVLNDEFINKLLEIIFENKRKNKRLGYDINFE
jgi:hypothetical protein